MAVALEPPFVDYHAKGMDWHQGEEENAITALYYDWLAAQDAETRWRCTKLLQLAYARRKDFHGTLELAIKEWGEHWGFQIPPTTKYPRLDPVLLGCIVHDFTVHPGMTIGAVWRTYFGGRYVDQFPTPDPADTEARACAEWLDETFAKLEGLQALANRINVATKTGGKSAGIDWSKDQFLSPMLDWESPFRKKLEQGPSQTTINILTLPQDRMEEAVRVAARRLTTIEGEAVQGKLPE